MNPTKRSHIGDGTGLALGMSKLGVEAREILMENEVRQRLGQRLPACKMMAKRVLIAEDYRDAREMMRYLLEFYGYDVLEACDGDEAVQNARQFHPDLILMDLMMPRMDGLTATRIIRETQSEVPIIALTALGNAAEAVALESGCNEVVEKPMDFNQLEPLLSHYLA